MSNEKEVKQTPLTLIEKELKEKTTQLQEVSNKVQEAKNFIQQNEPTIFALNGAIQQLNILKKELAK